MCDAGFSGARCEKRTCSAGYVNVATLDGQTTCQICPAGAFVPVGAEGQCSDFACPAGQADADSNPATPCSVCLAGTHTQSAHVGTCTECTAGTTDSDSNPVTPCVRCGPGNFTAPGSKGECHLLFQCASGTLDDDGNAATPCVPAVSVCGATTDLYVPAGSSGTDCERFRCPDGQEDDDTDPATPCISTSASTASSSSSSSVIAPVAGVLGALFLLVLLLAAILYRRQKRRLLAQRRELEEIRAKARTSVTRQLSRRKNNVEDVLARLEVPRDAVHTERELGSGEFGVVELGRLDARAGRRGAAQVAIKRLKGHVDHEQQVSFFFLNK